MTLKYNTCHQVVLFKLILFATMHMPLSHIRQEKRIQAAFTHSIDTDLQLYSLGIYISSRRSRSHTLLHVDNNCFAPRKNDQLEIKEEK